MRKYKLVFDPWGLLVFLTVMLPNFIWFAVPSPNDILRRESVTPVLDGVGSVCQVLFVAALCVVVNREREPLRMTALMWSCAVCGLLYYLGWLLYYRGIIHPAVILLLTVPPCTAFLLFAIDRKNYIAAAPAAVFSVCHLIYGLVNFVVC